MNFLTIQERRRRWSMWLGGFTVLTAATMLVALVHGTGQVSFAQLWSHSIDEQAMAREIFWGARLPRVLMGAIAGFALAGAGVSFQALLRNPLADPYVLGVTGGASLGGVLGLAVFSRWAPLGDFPQLLAHLVTWSAFAGALVSMLVMYAIARRSGGGRLSIYSLLLSGVVLTSFTTALIMFVNALVDFQQAHEILHWLMGNLSTTGLQTTGWFALYVLGAWSVLMAQTPAYNALTRGEEEALHLGVEVERVKRRTFFAASLLVGAVVSRCGMIGFVGLMIPHIARLLVGADHRLLLPAASLLGAAFLVATDALARTLIFPSELPVGVITALLGGPFFIFLLTSKRNRGGV